MIKRFHSKRHAVRFLKSSRISGATITRKGRFVFVEYGITEGDELTVSGEVRLKSCHQAFADMVYHSKRDPDLKGQLGRPGKRLSKGEEIYRSPLKVKRIIETVGQVA